jgi:hypothetical protein
MRMAVCQCKPLKAALFKCLSRMGFHNKHWWQDLSMPQITQYISNKPIKAQCTNHPLVLGFRVYTKWNHNNPSTPLVWAS